MLYWVEMNDWICWKYFQMGSLHLLVNIAYEEYNTDLWTNQATILQTIDGLNQLHIIRCRGWLNTVQ